MESGSSSFPEGYENTPLEQLYRRRNSASYHGDSETADAVQEEIEQYKIDHPGEGQPSSDMYYPDPSQGTSHSMGDFEGKYD